MTVLPAGSWTVVLQPAPQPSSIPCFTTTSPLLVLSAYLTKKENVTNRKRSQHHTSSQLQQARRELRRQPYQGFQGQSPSYLAVFKHSGYQTQSSEMFLRVCGSRLLIRFKLVFQFDQSWMIPLWQMVFRGQVMLVSSTPLWSSKLRTVR